MAMKYLLQDENGAMYHRMLTSNDMEKLVDFANWAGVVVSAREFQTPTRTRKVKEAE